MTKRMTLAQFTDLVDLRGPDSRDWPADRRADALSLLAGSAEARAILETARGVEALLADLPMLRAEDDLRRAVAAIPARPPAASAVRPITAQPTAPSPPTRHPALTTPRGGSAWRRYGGRPSALAPLAGGMAAALLVGMILGAHGVSVLAGVSGQGVPPSALPPLAQLAAAIDDTTAVEPNP